MIIGILGGGQLGRMFLQEAASYPGHIYVMDPAKDAPCAELASRFEQGDFADEDAVLAFGEKVDVIGIEIEHVSVAALKRLQAQGKRIIPSPQALEIIQDKGRQKQFYTSNAIPTTDFYLINTVDELDLDKIPLPFVQKLRAGGYDGRGVQIISKPEELSKLWNKPSLIEAMCDIDKEIGVMVVTDGLGEVLCYPIFEMVFNSELNQLDYVQAPAHLDPDQAEQAVTLAEKIALALNSPGVFAVEMFIDKKGNVLVNETAPRVHNSAHLTIEACVSSQFDQMWRLLASMPLGSPQQYRPAAMLNLIGNEGEVGVAILPKLDRLLAMDEVFVHWYGKLLTRPGRKMGHVTIMAKTEERLSTKLAQARQYLAVQAQKEIND